MRTTLFVFPIERLMDAIVYRICEFEGIPDTAVGREEIGDASADQRDSQPHK